MDVYLDGETIEHYKIYSRIPDYYLLEGGEWTKIEI
jgi:hypothetical protein